MTKISVEEFNEAIGRLVKERDNLLTQGNLKEARRLGTIRTSLKEWFEAGQTEELPAETREVLATFLLDGNSASPVPPPEANKQAEELKREAEQLRAEDLKREAERQRAEELKRETERQRLEELKREAERQRAEDLKREAERQHAEELKR
ncbi:MAG: hypothetical protein HXX20_12995, partial [Chloroflexi bacterium]|nr:hypothetical protein [Chloroflexota bacterium]